MLTRVAPADGAVDVPVNALVVVDDSRDGREDATFELRTRDGQQPVSFEVESRTRSSRYSTLTPSAPLQPNTTYELVLDWRSEIEVLSAFTTGAAVDSEPPSFSGVDSVAAEAMRSGDHWNSCVESGPSGGWFSTIRLGYDDSQSDIAYFVLEITGNASWLPGLQLIVPGQGYGDGHTLRAFSCSAPVVPQLIPYETYCARLTAFDLAGNRAGGHVLVCTEAEECAASFDENGWPLDECPFFPSPPPPPELIDPPVNTGGSCSSTSAGSAWLALALLVILRRRVWRCGPGGRSS